ncbi:MAG: ATP-dependent helicase, partial [Lentisphaeria bacterium]|nr:ATP-dependent helicase [Lentisphaeria bacterium]
RLPLGQNFRSKAGPIMLADAVIRQNQRRIPKALRLTQGLGGHIDVLALQTTREMGSAMVDAVQERHDAGSAYHNMVVLVRTFAQSPPVEQAFIAADIPYSIFGQQPFYKRPEVQTLVDYCRVAYLDKLMADGVYLDAVQSDQLRRSWTQIFPRPNRDIPGKLARTLVETALVQQAPIYHTLLNASTSQEPILQEQMNELGITLQWLSGAFHHGPLSIRTAHDMLRELDDRLDYSSFLQRRYGASATGDDQAETVHQLLIFAQGRGNLPAFLSNIQKLDELRTNAREQAGGEAITIRSIRSAKGLEWPVVLIPSCNPGIIPRHMNANVEEERRLFYMALTRSRHHLYLYYMKPEPSSFLRQADFDDVLDDLSAVRTAAAKYPIAWTDEDVEAMAVTAVERGLWTYFRDWAPWPEQIRRQAARRVSSYYLEQNERGSLQALGLPAEAMNFWTGAASGPQLDGARDLNGALAWLRRLGR